MFNFHGTTPSHRVTTRQQRHHSHRCPLFQVQRKAPTSPTPTLAADKKYESNYPLLPLQPKLRFNELPVFTHPRAKRRPA